MAKEGRGGHTLILRNVKGQEEATSSFQIPRSAQHNPIWHCGVRRVSLR